MPRMRPVRAGPFPAVTPLPPAWRQPSTDPRLDRSVEGTGARWGARGRKTDGRQRPLGIAALEDKIVQRTVVEVMNAIYEVDFLGFSYGFRPGRNQHQARPSTRCWSFPRA